VMDIESHDM